MRQAILTLDNVCADIAQYHILHDINLIIPEGGVHVLLGRNGAGKTTTLRTIMGILQAHSGCIKFDGQDITKYHSSDIAQMGVAYVPENMGIFGGLTVEENLRLAADKGRFDPVRLKRIYTLFPAIEIFWDKAAWSLSGGQKQMLAIARAIIEPRKLILIDEPTKGLAPSIIENMIEAFHESARETTIFLVEQNCHLASSLGETVNVVEDGKIIHSGDMKEFAQDKNLQTRLLSLSLDQHQ